MLFRPTMSCLSIATSHYLGKIANFFSWPGKALEQSQSCLSQLSPLLCIPSHGACNASLASFCLSYLRVTKVPISDCHMKPQRTSFHAAKDASFLRHRGQFCFGIVRSFVKRIPLDHTDMMTCRRWSHFHVVRGHCLSSRSLFTFSPGLAHVVHGFHVNLQIIQARSFRL